MIQQRANELKITHMWHPIIDFDQTNMREELPNAVKSMHKEIVRNPGVVYVHCTGGMLSPVQTCIQGSMLELDLNPGLQAIRYAGSLRSDSTCI